MKMEQKKKHNPEKFKWKKMKFGKNKTDFIVPQICH